LSFLPEGVAELLDQYVDSLNSLELIVAAATKPSRSWTANDAATHLGIPVSSAQRELERCVRLGLLTVDRGDLVVHRFAPSDPTKLEAVQRIVACYRSDRVGVINHVASRAMKRIEALANAFRLGGKKDG
jgi:hypothetical protein